MTLPSRCEEPVHHCCWWHPWSAEPIAGRRLWRHGVGYRQEGQARATQERYYYYFLVQQLATSSDILGTFVEASHHFTEGSVIVAEHTSTLQPYLACVCNGFKVSRLNTKPPEEINRANAPAT